MIALRLGAVAGRFLALVSLAKFLEPEDVALYGLFVASIAYLCYPLGLDFYTFSTRELMRSPRSRWAGMVDSHFALLSLLYVIVIPTTLLLFAFELLPWSALLWFLVLLPMEHLGLEIDRLLVAVGARLTASVTVFVRQGLWPLVITGIFMLEPEYRAIEFVFAAWGLGAVLAVSLGGCWLYYVARQGGTNAPDIAWIRRGIRIALRFLAGTMLLRLLFTVDRYAVELSARVEVLAAYTLFIGLANGLSLSIAAAVHQFVYPRMVTAEHAGDSERFQRALRSLRNSTVVLCVLYVAASLVLIDYLLELLGRGTYERYAELFPMTLAAAVLYNLSMVPHFVLYARDRDRAILGSTILGCLAFGIALPILAAQFGAHGVAAALILGNLVLLSAKAFAARQRVPL